MLNQCYYLLAFGLLTAAFFVQVKGATVTTDIIYDNDGLLGSTAAVQCSWSLDQGEIGISMTIGASGGKEFYLYLIGRDLQLVAQPDRDLRYTADNVTAGATAITMRISDLQCTDELNFLCTFSYNSQSVQNREDSSQLTLKAQPKPPQIQSTIPGPLTQGVVEFSNVSVTCSADTGRPDKGSVIWRIDRDNRPESIDPTDSRITLDSKGVGDLPCTERLTYTFRMPVTRDDQDLVITCFVLNDVFVTSAPLVCEDKTVNLCDQTETIRVHYGVSDVTVGQEPAAGNIYEGDSVTLTCFAPGFPAPTYTWVKVGEENQTLSGNTGGNVNKLVLSNVDIQNDSGQYNCTANNSVSGTPYSVTKDLNLVIYEATTTSTTVSTTPSPTTTPKKDTQKGNDDGDDDDEKVIIIAVVVSVIVVIIIAVIIGVCLWKRRQPKKEIEEPSEKPYNNRTNLSFQGGQPDLVADDKKFHNSSLNSSFDAKNEDGLRYADLTYDNRPRSRKPMAIGDAASDYSDIQMPQV